SGSMILSAPSICDTNSSIVVGRLARLSVHSTIFRPTSAWLVISTRFHIDVITLLLLKNSPERWRGSVPTFAVGNFRNQARHVPRRGAVEHPVCCDLRRLVFLDHRLRAPIFPEEELRQNERADGAETFPAPDAVGQDGFRCLDQ